MKLSQKNVAPENPQTWRDHSSIISFFGLKGKKHGLSVSAVKGDGVAVIHLPLTVETTMLKCPISEKIYYLYPQSGRFWIT